MQKSRNNCLKSKKRNMIIRQVKIDKHECSHVLCCYFKSPVLTHFPLTEGQAIFFCTRNNYCKLLASYGFNLQSFHLPFFQTEVCGASFCRIQINEDGFHHIIDLFLITSEVYLQRTHLD